MKLGLLCVEMVIIMFLGNIGSDFPDDLPSSCPRDKSRLVRTLIDKKILPIFDRYRIEMPIECPFHPHRDILWWPEDNLSAYILTDSTWINPEASSILSVKTITDKLTSFFTSVWRCPLCSKMFNCAETLATHWDLEHKLYRHRTENFVCLSDFCQFMRCDLMDRRRTYPTIGTSKYLAHMISSTLSIDPSNLLLPPLRSDFSSSSSYGCNKTAMANLERRCQTVVRQCILPLLISEITLKDFRDMEDDMVKETCGYLNCDKLFDLTVNEEPVRPLSICLLFGLLMIGGFSICYQIVWYLFELSIGLDRVFHGRKETTRQLKGVEASALPLPPMANDKSPDVVRSKGTSVPMSSSTTLEVGSSRPMERLSEGKRAVHSSSKLCKGASDRSAETSQEDASPGSSESRYIVTFPGNNRRYQRPSHLYLASELALLLEKRSMETVPEYSDDCESFGLAPHQQSVQLHYPHDHHYHQNQRLSSSSMSKPLLLDSRSPSGSSSGLTRSNVAWVSRQQEQNSDPRHDRRHLHHFHQHQLSDPYGHHLDDSQTSQGSQDSRKSKDSSRSTVSIQGSVAPVTRVSPTPSTSKAQHSGQYCYPSRRKDFALNKGRLYRYEGDEDEIYYDETEQLLTSVTTARDTKVKQETANPTRAKLRTPFGGTMSDVEGRTSHLARDNQPNEHHTSREVMFSVDRPRSDETQSETKVRIIGRRLKRPYTLPKTRLAGKTREIETDRDSSASDTVTSFRGANIESEPSVSGTSRQHLSQPSGMVRSISSSGVIKRAGMISQRYSSQPATVAPLTTAPKQVTLSSSKPSIIPVRSRSSLTKSKSMDNPIYPNNQHYPSPSSNR